jgi:hypothetical protein
MTAFGADGTPGDDKAIVDLCRLIIGAARNLLEWEEDIRFTHVPSEFQEALSALQGVSGRQLDELFRIPSELAKILAEEAPSGTRAINLVFSFPEGAVEAFGAAMDRGTEKLLARS